MLAISSLLVATVSPIEVSLMIERSAGTDSFLDSPLQLMNTSTSLRLLCPGIGN
jgi:hypothetical protein